MPCLVLRASTRRSKQVILFLVTFLVRYLPTSFESICSHQLDPPSDMILSVFPWVEEEQSALERRIQEHGKNGQDNALKLFLSLLIFLRRVLLQDAAVLFMSYPKSPLFSYAPLNTPMFRHFAQNSVNIIARAEADTRHKLDSLPHSVAETFRGLVTTNTIIQEEMRAADKVSRQRIEERLQSLVDLHKAHLVKGTAGRKRKAIEAVLEDFGMITMAHILFV